MELKERKLREYISYIEDLPKKFILSRGQFQNYELLSGALRKDKSGNRKYTKKNNQKLPLTIQNKCISIHEYSMGYYE